jgi:hypothetical protein
MKPAILSAIFFTIIFLTGCIPFPLETVTKSEAKKPYAKVLVMYAEGNFTLYKLDSATYNTAFRGNFNNLDNLTARKYTEINFKEELGSGQVRVMGSYEVFDVNTDIAYNEFNLELQKLGVEAVLVINKQNTGSAPAIAADDRLAAVNNCNYRFYLIDVKDSTPVWLAQAAVDYSTRQVAKSLINGHFITDTF